MKKITVLGGGSWGTALSVHLSHLNAKIVIYDIVEKQIDEINNKKSNSRYLPGITIPKNVTGTTAIKLALTDADFVIIAVPSRQMRETIEKAKPFIGERTVIINCSKGLEDKTYLRLSQVILATLGSKFSDKFCVLSGPTHAEEVSKGLPSAAVVAGPNEKTTCLVQELFDSSTFRIYTGTDIIGIELGGAIKNIIAIAAGISDGMGYGDNTKAALVTRGLQEAIRLGVNLGANQLTFAGLAGLGDLFVTCASKLSRNWKFGYEIGRGTSIEEALTIVDQIVEGIPTTEAMYRLSLEKNIEMPLTKKVYEVLFENLDPKIGVNLLMERSLKDEIEAR